MPSATHRILRLRGVTVRHRRVVALRDVSADLPCGRSVAICGPALYADGPGPPGGGVETYEAMHRHKLGTIIDALRVR